MFGSISYHRVKFHSFKVMRVQVNIDGQININKNFVFGLLQINKISKTY